MKDRIAVALPSIENPSKRIKVWVASRGCFDGCGSSSSSIGAGGAREKIDDEWHDDDKTDEEWRQQLEEQR